MHINEALLHNLMEQAKDHDFSMLCAGLTVLTKDAAEYLAATGKSGRDVRLFQDLYSKGLSTERHYWEEFGSEVFKPLQIAGLPSGFTAAAEAGHVDLSPISDPAILHEWTRFPGRDLLKRFSAKFRETICGKDGPYEKFQNGLIGQADLPLAIAATILTNGLSAATFWYPIAIYIALLLSKTALKTYCETGDIDGADI
ncbi:hypothetical protein [Desulfobulbus oligotrophicus]|jgi:hypothetical protein|uniref:Uncharacterized protein n=1 Tax=Desulfobulbus oligotrophicus TaxID=1909699 RepID=A0A7T5VDZ0_9BACT|nr:hypothetical protein [Desulfobulbus oligotrophicus]MDY0391683.1 hypothetical protein [Desulfobulbus oligotrophicus]QQG66148.1 hypothetical protein HP555_09850 [Desulfobulbus oligotrophicus]